MFGSDGNGHVILSTHALTGSRPLLNECHWLLTPWREREERGWGGDRRAKEREREGGERSGREREITQNSELRTLLPKD